MKKYLAFAKISLQAELFYRTDFFFFFIRQSVYFLVQILLFSVVFRENNLVAGFNYSQTIEYFLVIYLINLLTATRIDSRLAYLIREGRLSRPLLRPASFLWARFFSLMGRRVYRMIYISLALLILFILGAIEFNFFRTLIFLLILVNAVVLSFLYRFVLGTLSFWLINITSVLWLFRQSANFLGGGWLPLSFFPDWTVRVLKAFPFYLILGFPAEFFQGKVSWDFVLRNIIAQLGWVVIFFLIVALLWNKGVREYEAVGS